MDRPFLRYAPDRMDVRAPPSPGARGGAARHVGCMGRRALLSRLLGHHHGYRHQLGNWNVIPNLDMDDPPQRRGMELGAAIRKGRLRVDHGQSARSEGRHQVDPPRSDRRVDAVSGSERRPSARHKRRHSREWEWERSVHAQKEEEHAEKESRAKEQVIRRPTPRRLSNTTLVALRQPVAHSDKLPKF